MRGRPFFLKKMAKEWRKNLNNDEKGVTIRNPLSILVELRGVEPLAS